MYNPGLVGVVNVLGHSNNFNEILVKKICFKLKCESMGSQTNKKFRTFVYFHSFYYGHHISTIEGGIFTNDKKFYNISLAIDHGWAR